MQLDVHDTKRRIERAVQVIKDNSSLPESEKEKIVKFDEYLAAKGIGEKRRLVYLVTLPHLRAMLGKNFRTGTKQDLIGLMAKIEKRDLEEWTKHTYRVVTKKFYQWLHGMDDQEYPSQVSWIHSRVTNNRHVLPEELLTNGDGLYKQRLLMRSS